MAPVAFRRIREHVLFDRKRSAQEEERRNAEVLKSNPKARINRHHQQFLDTWWQLSYRREAMLEAIRVLPRYIAVSRVATRHRLPVLFFVSPEIRPGDALCVFAFADDYSFGVLQSTLHLDWFIELCSTLKSDLRYTANVFEKFPWPQAPSNRDVIAVVEAVVALLDFRAERQAQGIPVGRQYDSLRDPGRSRLRDLHEELDRAVFDAYGFDRGDDTLAQLLALNASIAEEETAGLTRPRGPGSIGFPDVDRTTWRIEPSLQLSKG